MDHMDLNTAVPVSYIGAHFEQPFPLRHTATMEPHSWQPPPVFCLLQPKTLTCRDDRTPSHLSRQQLQNETSSLRARERAKASLCCIFVLRMANQGANGYPPLAASTRHSLPLHSLARWPSAIRSDQIIHLL